MKRDEVFIEHILHEISYLEKKCSGKTIDDLNSDEDLQHMVSRALEIIGEHPGIFLRKRKMPTLKYHGKR